MTPDQTQKPYTCHNCFERLSEDRMVVEDQLVVMDCPHCDTMFVRSSYTGQLQRIFEEGEDVDDVRPALREVRDTGMPEKVVFMDENGEPQEVDLDYDADGGPMVWSLGSDESCDMPGCDETEDLETVEGFDGHYCAEDAETFRSLARYEVTEDGLRLREDAEWDADEQEKVDQFKRDWDAQDGDPDMPWDGE